MQKNLANNTCRICLKDNEVLNSLFDEAEGFNLKLIELLDKFEDIKIDLNDVYPKYICVECTNELLITAKFREKYQKTQEILSHFVTEEICEDYDDHREESVSDDDNEIVEESQFNNDDKDNNDYDKDDNNGDKDDNLVETYINEENQNQIENDNKTKSVIEKELNKAKTSYVIFDSNDLGEDITIEIEKSKFDDIKKISDDQILYDRIVNAANAVVNKQKNNIKSRTFNTENKPQIINCNCDLCGAGFTHLNNLRKHLENHGIKEIYECGICLWPFSKINKVQSHYFIDHSQIISYNENSSEIENDESNNEILSSEDKIREKIQLNVKKKKKHNEKILEKSEFVNILHYQKDITKNHICETCKKSFSSKSALVSHERIHTGDRPYKCKECQKSFTTQGGLVLHTRRHTGFKPFVCNTCGKGFVESSNLKVHIRSHSGEKPHKCTICERGFSRVFLLQLHLRTHTGEKPFNCPWCEKKFAQQGDLASHKRIHTGERPHKCPHCEKCFIKSSALNVHIRTHFKSTHKKQDRWRKLLLLDDDTITDDFNENSNQQQDDSNLHNNLISNNYNETEIMVTDITIDDTTVTDNINNIENNRICVIENSDPLEIE